MQNRKSQIENLKQDLETESNLRIKNQEALADCTADVLILCPHWTQLPASC